MIDLVVHAMVERVASGLRAMKVKPDAFVFVDGMGELAWDDKTACGIPVLHGSGFLPPHHGSESTDCPFVPVWESEQRDSISRMATSRFTTGMRGMCCR